MVFANYGTLVTWVTNGWYWTSTSIRSSIVERKTCVRLSWTTTTSNEPSAFIENAVDWWTRWIICWWMSYMALDCISRLSMFWSSASCSKMRRRNSRRSRLLDKSSAFCSFQAALRSKTLAKMTKKQRIVKRCMLVDSWVDVVRRKEDMVSFRETDEYLLMCLWRRVEDWAVQPTMTGKKTIIKWSPRFIPERKWRKQMGRGIFLPCPNAAATGRDGMGQKNL